jgi:predicted DNA-binding protein (UPF0251 family)
VVILAFVVFFLWKDGKNERAAHAREREEKDKTHKEELERIQASYRELGNLRLSDLREMSQARLGDSEALHKQMLEVVKQCTSVMESTAASLDAHKDVTVEHRDASKQAAEELRKLSTLLHNLSEEIKLRIRPR